MPKKTWKLIAGITGVILIVLAAIAISWPRPERGGEENVRLIYNGSFIFLDQDNRPLENLILVLPVPQIENRFAMSVIENTWLSNPWRPENGSVSAAGWVIFEYENVDFENGSGTWTQLVTSGPVYYEFGTGSYGPAIIANVSVDAPRLGLYPQELVRFEISFSLPKSLADRVTIETYGDPETRTFAYWYSSENRKIDIQWSFVLARASENWLPLGDYVEDFTRYWENAGSAWYSVRPR
jgi:hypothetical protein